MARKTTVRKLLEVDLIDLVIWALSEWLHGNFRLLSKSVIVELSGEIRRVADLKEFAGNEPSGCTFHYTSIVPR